MFKTLYTLLEQEIPQIGAGFTRISVIFIIALGVVYIFGRMLEFFNTNRSRNSIAVLTIFPASYISILIYDMQLIVHPWEIYWRTLVYGCGASILFVLIGWKLFDRVDHFLDRKIAPDDDGSPRRHRRSRRTNNKG